METLQRRGEEGGSKHRGGEKAKESQDSKKAAGLLLVKRGLTV